VKRYVSWHASEANVGVLLVKALLGGKLTVATGVSQTADTCNCGLGMELFVVRYSVYIASRFRMPGFI
jgi:hypothetical protein